jgi:hypothetical protein
MLFATSVALISFTRVIRAVACAEVNPKGLVEVGAVVVTAA